MLYTDTQFQDLRARLKTDALRQKYQEKKKQPTEGTLSWVFSYASAALDQTPFSNEQTRINQITFISTLMWKAQEQWNKTGSTNYDQSVRYMLCTVVAIMREIEASYSIRSPLGNCHLYDVLNEILADYKYPNSPQNETLESDLIKFAAFAKKNVEEIVSDFIPEGLVQHTSEFAQAKAECRAKIEAFDFSVRPGSQWW